MGIETLRQQLETLEGVLREHGESDFAHGIRIALDGTDGKVEAFLTSNGLWGGAGSIADQAGWREGRDARRSIEAVLVTIGLEQLRHGLVNVRTEMWVDAFSK